MKAVADADIANLKYFRVTRGKIAGVPVDISRTGYTGDLGYEIWMPWNDAVKVWDALADKGKQFDLHAAGMLALDVARVEAGLLLIEVDYTSSKKALIPSQKFSPYELGFAKMVHLGKENFIGKRALEQDAKNGVPRQLVGLEVDWTDIEQLYDRYGLTPAAPSQASRVAVPVYSGEKQAGKATTTSWSPILKKLIALGQRRNRICEARNPTPDGNHDRSNAPENECEGDEPPVLQPTAKDGDPGVNRVAADAFVRRPRRIASGATRAALTRVQPVACRQNKSRPPPAPAPPSLQSP